MPVRSDTLIVVRLVIFVAVLSASLFAAAAPASGQVKLTFDKHPAIDFGDTFTASFRVKSQNDWRDFPSEPGADQKNVFDPYRERIAVEGWILGRVQYHVEREFHETSSPWKNIYLDTRVIHGLHLQGGQFNMPFGLDQTTSLMDQDFNYHSLAGSFLAPGRSPGVLTYGDFFKKNMATYDDGSRGDKAKELALAAGFNQQVESAIPDDFTVKVFRDTAVVWFTLKLVGIRQGQRSEMQLRYTDVWVIRDGRWLCVSTQSTRVNPG